MALDYRFDIKLAVENALYEHTTDNMTLKEIEEIGNTFIKKLKIEEVR